MPLKQFKCIDCEHEYEDLIMAEYKSQCPECQSLKVKQIPSSFGGYKITGNNSASTRPKGAGSRTKGKA